MDTVRMISLLSRMDQLIRLRATGCPKEFADKLEVSVRSLYYYIAKLKELGAQVSYNRCCNSYEYINEKRLQIGYFSTI